MTAVMEEISPRPPTQDEPEGVILVDDLEVLSEGAIPGCNDDNPYR
ncbi:hypothetical protein [Streptomyces pakalii]|uniref:Uncharacterized protein n=1 Tax=Streptomyces pakalii TaxID=3036494 RepID=A0ABT7DF48_9ACTN|nr:hypothetical protein [Streptomyces pakalii]MDJ1643489.1 hypothetical protein [Streptomyces pakalii]